MNDKVRKLHSPRQITRIKVTGSAGRYHVQNGDEPPVLVMVRQGGPTCECGQPSCEHLDSLLMCGFIGQPEEVRKAA